MGAITAEHVAIAELVVYIPTGLLAVWVVFRHGAHKQLGWIYLAIFCTIRIVGSAMEIQSVNNPGDTTNEEWALILQSVGLSPLLLSTLGLLKRVFDEVSDHIPSGGKNVVMQSLSRGRGITGIFGRIYTKRATATSRRSRAVQLLHVPALVGLILSISGGTDESSSDASQHAGGRNEVRAAVVIFGLVYLAAVGLWVATLRDFRGMAASQTRVYLAVMLALPLIAVRLLYSLISDFGDNPQFGLVTGDETIRLGMASVEEFLVVVMYTIVGLVTPRSAPAAPPVGNRRGEYDGETDAYAATYVVRDAERGGGGRGHGRH